MSWKLILKTAILADDDDDKKNTCTLTSRKNVTMLWCDCLFFNIVDYFTISDTNNVKMSHFYLKVWMNESVNENIAADL